ncbi:Uncharacterised protein [Mycobacteroides abscessus subsp. massiliense]|nr:Uncharacterised protein [Mycobacteroides abscessus subsp. massiliense]
MRDECSPARLAQTGYAVEHGGRHPPGPLAPVEGDGEPVRLVTHPLQQVQRLTGARQNHRIRLARNPHLFEPLGQSDHRDVGDAQLAEFGGGRIDLRRPAIHDEKIGRIGELA